MLILEISYFWYIYIIAGQTLSIKVASLGFVLISQPSALLLQWGYFCHWEVHLLVRCSLSRMAPFSPAPLCQTYWPLASRAFLWTSTASALGAPWPYLLNDFQMQQFRYLANGQATVSKDISTFLMLQYAMQCWECPTAKETRKKKFGIRNGWC